MAWNNELLEIEVLILHHTEEAALIEYEGEEHWIPKRYISSEEEIDWNNSEEEQEVSIPNWLAYERDMI